MCCLRDDPWSTASFITAFASKTVSRRSSCFRRFKINVKRPGKYSSSTHGRQITSQQQAAVIPTAVEARPRHMAVMFVRTACRVILGFVQPPIPLSPSVCQRPFQLGKYPGNCFQIVTGSISTPFQKMESPRRPPELNDTRYRQPMIFTCMPTSLHRNTGST